MTGSCCRTCQIKDMAPELQVTRESAHFVCRVKRSTQHSASKLWVLLADLTKVLYPEAARLTPAALGENILGKC